MTNHVVPDVGWKEFNSLVGDIVDLDEEFRLACLQGKPHMLNDISVKTDKDALSLRDKLTIRYTGTVVNFEEGTNPIEQPIDISYWMRTPVGVDWYMHPTIKIMLDSKIRIRDPYTKEYIYPLSYFCDSTYRLPTGYIPDKRFKRLIDADIPRGINKFYHHFDQFIDIWFNISNRRGGYQKLSVPIYDLVQQYRDRVFCKHLPMYSNHTFAIESNDNFESMDKSVIQHALDAVFTLTSLDMEIKNLSVKRMEGKAWKVVTCMGNSVNAFLTEVFLKKEGLLRKSNCGTPASFNSRAVIASNQRPNSDYRHLMIPWGVSLVLFAQEIGGILIREHGFSVSEVFHARAKYAKQFDPLIYDITMKFLSSHRHGGKMVVFHRPPTLERGSHQTLIVPGIETDPRINVISMSNLVTRAFNADSTNICPQMSGSLLWKHSSNNLVNCWKEYPKAA